MIKRKCSSASPAQAKQSASDDRAKASADTLSPAGGFAKEMRGMGAEMKEIQGQLAEVTSDVISGLSCYAVGKVVPLLCDELRLSVSSAEPEEFRNDRGTVDEIELVIRGEIDARPVVLLCTIEPNLTVSDVSSFIKVANRVRPKIGCEDARVLFVAFEASSEVRQAVQDVGAALAFPLRLVVPPRT